MPLTVDGRRPGRVVGSVALAAAGLLAVGCAGPPEVEAEPSAAVVARDAVVADLAAEVVQYRRDAQRDVVQVKVTNHGAEDVHVTRVELRSPTFASPPTEAKDSTVAAGRSVDLVVPLAPPACDERTGPDAAEEGSHVAVLVVDGTAAPLPVGADVLEQVRVQRCAEAAVAQRVDLAWEPAWSDAGTVDGEPALRGRLVASPVAADGPVELAVDTATTLFTVAEPVTATLTDRPVTLDVVLTVTRCDPHAVAEDKKGYLVPVRVRTEDVDEVVVEVAVPEPERGALQDLIDRTCR